MAAQESQSPYFIAPKRYEDDSGRMTVSISINDQAHTIMIEPRMTLLDALREELALTGTKKGCDRGECGACTGHVDGRRALSCMTLTAMQEGKRVTTIEGLEREGELHALQAAFIEHDGFQCGLCTSGQIMSGGRRDRRSQSRLAKRRYGRRAQPVYPRGIVRN